MIAAIQGKLIHISSDAILIQPEGGLTYEVLVCSYASAQLTDRLGEILHLHTLHFLESQNQGSSFLPRLAGFLTTEDRAFFQLFTTCKGVGNRKALRALALETSMIAAAIADRDAATLQSLPEIGKRTAETIIATLHGKVDRFIAANAFTPETQGDDTHPQAPTSPGIARQALEVLLQLGETRIAAVAWINQALSDPDNRPENVQSLIERVYQIKAGS